ncbi:MAG: hypothetical protein LC739_01135 [Actinobacteria bacterium]|nr:hypothetical protein [Actinomycetota bacterium]
MLRALLLILELALLALIAYNLAVALFGWKNPTPARPGAESSRFVIVIPAHNEERVIARPVNDLTEQLRPGDQLWVLADRCTDATAAVARTNGAKVAERPTGPDGKGVALDWWTNLGWPADLGGSGMCITATALQAAGGFGDSLVEDQDLGIRCFLAGYSVRWLHDVRIGDEKPSTAAVAMRQRSRWISGRRTLARRWLPKLLARGQPAAFDLALRLVQPSRIGVAMLSALVAVASALGAPLLPWPLWAAVAFGQLVIPIPFLLRDGVPARYLGSYPLLVLLPVLKLAGRFRRNRGWYHTPHGLGDLGSDRSGPAE